jgi:hypothetical protein
MTSRYLVSFNQQKLGDASSCLINAINCVDDDHWRGVESTVTVTEIQVSRDNGCECVCACGDKYQPCGQHVEVDPSSPCEDCQRIEEEE